MNPGLHVYKSCVSKVKHTTLDSVKRAQERQEEQYDIRIDYYKCQICKGWHLTSGGSK